MRILSYLLSGLLIAYLLWGLHDPDKGTYSEATATESDEGILSDKAIEPGSAPPKSPAVSEAVFVESPREAEGYLPQSLGEDIDFDDVSVFDDAPAQSLGDDIDVEDLSVFDDAPQIDVGENIDVEDVDISAFEIVQDLGEDVDLEDFFGIDSAQPEQSLGEDVDPDTP